MNWIQRKIYLYNVTFGLYMLDSWERYFFNTLVIVLMWFMFYNGSRYITEFCKRMVIVIEMLALASMVRLTSIKNWNGWMWYESVDDSNAGAAYFPLIFFILFFSWVGLCDSTSLF